MTDETYWRARRSDDSGQTANSSGDAQGSAQMEAKASRMHRQVMLRGRHFLTPVMADTAMGVMLSLYVGEVQGTPVSTTVLAAANVLSRGETTSLVERLVDADLAVVRTSIQGEAIIGLTPRGSTRMQSYISAYPGV